MRILLALALCAFLATPAMAAFSGPGAAPGAQGGFQGPVGAAQAQTVEAASRLGDDARVVLTGNIVEQLAGSKDKFLFRDSTGQIIADIDHKVFQGRTVTPANTVRISGKLDKDFGKPLELDVKFLEIVK